MGDFMSPLFLPLFIEEYRQHRCLWLVTGKEYSNKRLKLAAYKKLVEVTKKVVPNCNVDFVKKKIDLLRGNFRREHKKVKTSMRTGSGADAVHTPKLWYYKLLLFLTEQGEPTKSRQSISSLDPTATTPSPGNTPLLDLEDDEETVISNLEDEGSTQQQEVEPSKPGSFKKRKLNASEELLVKARRRLEPPLDDYEKITMAWAVELRRMDPQQQLFAKKAINDILFEGQMGTLSRDSVQINVNNITRTFSPLSGSVDSLIK